MFPTGCPTYSRHVRRSFPAPPRNCVVRYHPVYRMSSHLLVLFTRNNTKIATFLHTVLREDPKLFPRERPSHAVPCGAVFGLEFSMAVLIVGTETATEIPTSPFRVDATTCLNPLLCTSFLQESRRRQDCQHRLLLFSARGW